MNTKTITIITLLFFPITIPLFLIGITANLIWFFLKTGWCYMDEKLFPEVYEILANAKKVSWKLKMTAEELRSETKKRT